MVVPHINSLEDSMVEGMAGLLALRRADLFSFITLSFLSTFSNSASISILIEEGKNKKESYKIP